MAPLVPSGKRGSRGHPPGCCVCPRRNTAQLSLLRWKLLELRLEGANLRQNGRGQCTWAMPPRSTLPKALAGVSVHPGLLSRRSRILSRNHGQGPGRRFSGKTALSPPRGPGGAGDTAAGVTHTDFGSRNSFRIMDPAQKSRTRGRRTRTQAERRQPKARARRPARSWDAHSSEPEHRRHRGVEASRPAGVGWPRCGRTLQAPPEGSGPGWTGLVLRMSLPPALRCHLGHLCALGGGSPSSPRTDIVGRGFLFQRAALAGLGVFYAVTRSSASLGGSGLSQARVVTGKPSFMPDRGLCGGLIPGPLS